MGSLVARIKLGPPIVLLDTFDWCSKIIQDLRCGGDFLFDKFVSMGVVHAVHKGELDEICSLGSFCYNNLQMANEAFIPIFYLKVFGV